MKLVPALAALTLTAPLLAGCGSSDTEGLSVVTSFYPLEYVAARIAGEHATITNLTSPGQEPHDLELTIKQTAAVSDADLVVYQRGFQAAVDDAVDTTGPAGTVDAAEAADLVPAAEGDGLDPHFWLDPTRLAAVAEPVEKALAEADPDHAADFAANLAALQQDLQVLDQETQQGLSDCARDIVVVSHDAFAYYGERYQLRLHAINGLSPDAEPSPAHIRELQDLIHDEGITTVFSETLGSHAMADTLADDLGIETAVLDPIEGLGDETADEDYLSLMRANLAALQQANGCR